MGEAKRRRSVLRQDGGATLIIHNGDRPDEVWDNDHGCFNVTKGYRLAVGPVMFDLAEIIRTHGHLEVDLDYVDRIPTERLNRPILMLEDHDGKVYMIDGRHRVEYWRRQGATLIAGMIVQRQDREKIIVTYTVADLPGGEVKKFVRMGDLMKFMKGEEP